MADPQDAEPEWDPVEPTEDVLLAGSAKAQSPVAMMLHALRNDDKFTVFYTGSLADGLELPKVSPDLLPKEARDHVSRLRGELSAAVWGSRDGEDRFNTAPIEWIAKELVVYRKLVSDNETDSNVAAKIAADLARLCRAVHVHYSYRHRDWREIDVPPRVDPGSLEAHSGDPIAVMHEALRTLTSVNTRFAARLNCGDRDAINGFLCNVIDAAFHWWMRLTGRTMSEPDGKSRRPAVELEDRFTCDIEDQTEAARLLGENASSNYLSVLMRLEATAGRPAAAALKRHVADLVDLSSGGQRVSVPFICDRLRHIPSWFGAVPNSTGGGKVEPTTCVIAVVVNQHLTNLRRIIDECSDAGLVPANKPARTADQADLRRARMAKFAATMPAVRPSVAERTVEQLDDDDYEWGRPDEDAWGGSRRDDAWGGSRRENEPDDW
jgi:hypothetical protein